MRTFTALWLAIGIAASALAAGSPALSGTWIFKADKSKGVGMMRAVAITEVITQEGPVIKVHETSVSRGQEQTHDSIYDTSGTPKPNQSPMGDSSSTVSHWQDGKLVITWTEPGAVAGTTSVQTETRTLSEGDKTMTVEWSRGGKSGMVMVFERQ